jgi:hypothetical protein
MSHSHFEMPSALYDAYSKASTQTFYPAVTVRCSGDPMFRSQLARDLGCLLDVDRRVVAWMCLPRQLDAEIGFHVFDFLVTYDDGTNVYLDAVDDQGSADVTEAAAAAGLRHRFECRGEIEHGFRLLNARDLLRYARWRTPLNDRVRMLAVLDEAGSLQVGECMGLFREVAPMTGIAWMTLHRMIEIDLDETIIGPVTVVRRFQH